MFVHCLKKVDGSFGVLIGIDEEGLETLQAGMVVSLDITSEEKADGIPEIFVTYGETETEIRRSLKKVGIEIPPKFKVVEIEAVEAG